MQLILSDQARKWVWLNWHPTFPARMCNGSVYLLLSTLKSVVGGTEVGVVWITFRQCIVQTLIKIYVYTRVHNKSQQKDQYAHTHTDKVRTFWTIHKSPERDLNDIRNIFNNINENNNSCNNIWESHVQELYLPTRIIPWRDTSVLSHKFVTMKICLVCNSGCGYSYKWVCPNVLYRKALFCLPSAYFSHNWNVTRFSERIMIIEVTVFGINRHSSPRPLNWRL